MIKNKYICDDTFYKPEEIAEKLGVCVMTVYRYIKDKKLGAYKLSRKCIRISETQLKEFRNAPQ